MNERLYVSSGNKGEKYVLAGLLSQSVLLGIFLGAFDIIAHSLFLSVFDVKMLAKGYVVSGIAGVLFSILFNRLRAILSYRKLSVINLAFVTALTLLTWLGLVIAGDRWIVFVFFVFLGPLNILVMMGFRNTSGVLASNSRKRTHEKITDRGLIAGIIFICYLIPIMIGVGITANTILLTGALSVLVATIIQASDGHTGDVEKETESADARRERQSVFKLFLTDRSVRLVGIFVALSVIALFFVQYSFMAVTREQYPSVEELARFLGVFTGSMMILILLGKTFVFSFLLRTFGLRMCLVLSPVLLLVLTGAALITGMLLGYAHESAFGFMMFFVLLALSRLFSKSFKDAVELPSVSVISLSIDGKIRDDVQTGMSGIFSEVAVFSSGLILSGLGMLSFTELIHFSFVLFFIILLWLFIALKLYSEYRKSIKSILGAIAEKARKKAGYEDDIFLFRSRLASSVAFRKEYFSLISGDLSMLSIVRGRHYYERLFTYALDNNDINMLPALKKISGITDLDKDIRERASEIMDAVKKSGPVLGFADSRTDHARKLLAGARMPQPSEIIRLLRDSNIESKKFAVFIIGKFRISDMLPDVCECLGINGLEKEASAVIRSFGKEAVNELIRYYLVASGNENACRLVLRLLSDICEGESRDFIYSRLWSGSRNLREEALNCLIRCGFKPSPEEKKRLHQLISVTIGNITWNMSAKSCLVNGNNGELLKILGYEDKRWNNYLFDLLSITYDPMAVGKLRQAIAVETYESTSFAVEMIDLMTDESISPLLIALFNDMPLNIKVKHLHRYFPGHVPRYEELLEDILNRDYNLLEIWTRVAAIRSIQYVENNILIDSLSALMFSPEDIIREEAARILARSDINIYRSVAKRIPGFIKRRLDNIVNGETAKEELLYEKTLFLKRCFKEIREEKLLHLAEMMNYVASLSSATEIMDDDIIIWPLSEAQTLGKVYLHYGHEIPGSRHENITGNDSACYVLALKAVETFMDHFPDISSNILGYLEEYD
jgi:AAA family ATP:ADP antiporter